MSKNTSISSEKSWDKKKKISKLRKSLIEGESSKMVENFIGNNLLAEIHQKFYREYSHK
jgi:hypothetical protein